MSIIKQLGLAASVMLAVPVAAQVAPTAPAAPASNPAKPDHIVVGATPDRVTQVERCQGRKFETLVEIDPVKKRTTRIKLCANPGSSDADWVKTLQAAVAQIEQRNMPPEPREKLIGELRNEIAKYAPASKSTTVAPSAAFTMSGRGASKSLIAPAERFETSTLPPLLPRKLATTGTAAIDAPVHKPMSIRIKCLARRESGPGTTCDYFERGTTLAISAVVGLEDGGTLRFLRRGEARGEVVLAAMQPGQTSRVSLPVELCRGVANTKFEIELLGPKSAGAAAARFGPYRLRC